VSAPELLSGRYGGEPSNFSSALPAYSYFLSRAVDRTPQPDQLSAFGTQRHNPRYGKRRWHPHDLAFLTLPFGPHMLFANAHPLNHDFPQTRENFDHFSGFSLVVARNYFYYVAFLYSQSF